MFARRSKWRVRERLRRYIFKIIVVVATLALLSDIYKVPGKLRNMYTNSWWEVDVDESAFPPIPLRVERDVYAVMLSLEDRPPPSKELWRSLGFPDGSVFPALHYAREQGRIQNTLSTDTVSVGELALLATTKLALQQYLRQSQRSHVIIFEDDVLPGSKATADFMRNLVKLPTGGDMNTYYFGETTRCGRYNVCRGINAWRRAYHPLVGGHAVMLDRAAAMHFAGLDAVNLPLDDFLSTPPFKAFRYDAIIEGDPVFCGLYRQADVGCYTRKASVIQVSKKDYELKSWAGMFHGASELAWFAQMETRGH
jgi:hypothetical protein